MSKITIDVVRHQTYNPGEASGEGYGVSAVRRLQTDRIDLCQIHRFDPATPLDEMLRALDDLVRASKVRYAGCSNFAAGQIVKAL